jgi:hypothetical protein
MFHPATLLDACSYAWLSGGASVGGGDADALRLLRPLAVEPSADALARTERESAHNWPLARACAARRAILERAAAPTTASEIALLKAEVHAIRNTLRSIVQRDSQESKVALHVQCEALLAQIETHHPESVPRVMRYVQARLPTSTERDAGGAETVHIDFSQLRRRQALDFSLFLHSVIGART